MFTSYFCNILVVRAGLIKLLCLASGQAVGEPLSLAGKQVRWVSEAERHCLHAHTGVSRS